MTEAILVAIIGALGLLIGSVLAWGIALRKMPKEIKVLNSEEQENLSVALSNAVSAYNNSVTASNTLVKNLEGRVDELEAHRAMRSREIFTLQQNFEAQSREYAKKMQELQDTISALQAQVDEGSKKYEKLKKTTFKLYQALKDANVPIPDIDSELIDTLDKIKPVK
jgi:predicted RNase H-like nuclease (RuvC/YqgF family)